MFSISVMNDLSGNWPPASSPDPFVLNRRAGAPSTLHDWLLWRVLFTCRDYVGLAEAGACILADVDRLVVGLETWKDKLEKGRGLRNLMIPQMGGLGRQSNLVMTNTSVWKEWISQSGWLYVCGLLGWAKQREAQSQQTPLIGSLMKSTDSG